MGEAKRKAAVNFTPAAPAILRTPSLIFHWTSSIKVHQIREEGVLRVESPEAYTVTTESGLTMMMPGHRRSYSDYPGLVWFTEKDKPPSTMAWSRMGAALGARRVALAFDPLEIGAVRWADYPGRKTSTGRKMDDLARKRGDSPGAWWVCEHLVETEACKGMLYSEGGQ